MRFTFTLMLGCILFAASKNYAQCGTDPTSGTTAPTGSAIYVNTYYSSTASTTLNATSLTLGMLDTRTSTPAIIAGDMVVIMQMQGADINSTNTNSYGDGLTGAPGSGYLGSNLYAGRFEYATVSGVSGAVINFSAPLANIYYHQTFTNSAPIQRYQIIRVPRNYDFTLASGNTIVAPAWTTTFNGTGGVVIIDAANTMTINGTINVSGLGFRGGGGKTFSGASTTLSSNGSGILTNTDYRWNSLVTNVNNGTGGAKGEGIAGTPIYRYVTGATTTATGMVEGYIDGSMGWGAPGNAGGGGTDGAPVGANQNQYNSGGGGGGNGGTGGRGGSGWHNGGGSATTYPTGGYGGVPYAQRSITQFVMGGGGGAGTANNSVAADEHLCSGGAGGGIILLRARNFAGTTGLLNANGGAAPGIPVGGRTDAVGGGGAGGTIVAITRTNVANGLSGITATAIGGAGGNSPANYDHGPGGGGAGGVVISNGTFAAPPAVTGGLNGQTTSGPPNGTVLNNAYGATPGTTGVVITLPGAPIFTSAAFFPSACGILPVRLESFTASLNGNSTILNWEVAQAIDFAGFDVEYSTDGFNFVEVGDLPFRSSQSKYEFIHAGNNSAISYYRLKLKDNNGKAEYSKILTIRQNTSNKALTLYPQPAKGFTTVQVAAINKQLVLVQVFNTNGSRVAQKQVQLGAGNNIFLIDNLEKLSSGLYTVRMTIDGKPQQAKLIISN